MTCDEVKTKREAAGLTREQMARRCGVSINTVRGWESTHAPGGLGRVVIDMVCDRASRRPKKALQASAI